MAPSFLFLTLRRGIGSLQCTVFFKVKLPAGLLKLVPAKAGNQKYALQDRPKSPPATGRFV